MKFHRFGIRLPAMVVALIFTMCTTVGLGCNDANTTLEPSEGPKQEPLQKRKSSGESRRQAGEGGPFVPREEQPAKVDAPEYLEPVRGIENARPGDFVTYDYRASRSPGGDLNTMEKTRVAVRLCVLRKSDDFLELGIKVLSCTREKDGYQGSRTLPIDPAIEALKKGATLRVRMLAEAPAGEKTSASSKNGKKSGTPIVAAGYLWHCRTRRYDRGMVDGPSGGSSITEPIGPLYITSGLIDSHRSTTGAGEMGGSSVVLTAIGCDPKLAAQDHPIVWTGKDTWFIDEIIRGDGTGKPSRTLRKTELTAEARPGSAVVLKTTETDLSTGKSSTREARLGFRFFLHLFTIDPGRMNARHRSGDTSLIAHALAPVETHGGVSLKVDLKSSETRWRNDDDLEIESRLYLTDLAAPRLASCPYPLLKRPWVFGTTQARAGTVYRSEKTSLLTYATGE